MDRIVYLAAGRAASGTTEEVVRDRRAQRALRPPRRRAPRPRPGPGRRRRRRSAARPRPVDDGAVPGRGPRRVSRVLAPLFEPGFFASGPVHVRARRRRIVRVVAGVVGVFTVIRGQSFAGQALADIGTTGGSGAFLVGVNPLWASSSAPSLAAGGHGADRRPAPRGRDLATGIVLGAGARPGRAVPLPRTRPTRAPPGRRSPILFGSMFAIAARTVPWSSLLQRPRARDHRCPATGRCCSARSAPSWPRPAASRSAWSGALYLLALALAVALAAMTIGAILTTALLIGPAATALRLTKRARSGHRCWPARIGVGATWLGIAARLRQLLLAARQHGWPVSFFVVDAHLRRLPVPTCAPPAPTRAVRPARAARRDPSGAEPCSPAS